MMEQTEAREKLLGLQCNIWWRAFLDDPFYGHYKLKRVKSPFPRAWEPRTSIVPVVDKDVFCTIEDHRLPFFTKTQVGLSPNPDLLFKDSEVREAVILCFSVYSGAIDSISIYRFKGPRPVEELQIIPYPNHIKMLEILDSPFPEVLQVEFGFKKRNPLFSERAEIARSPIQQFQNMSYRDDFIPHHTNVGRARSMLLVNEYMGITPMYLLSKERNFDLGYFTFDIQREMTGCGIIPKTPPYELGQSIRSFADAYLLLTPLDFYLVFKERYQGPEKWKGIELSWRELTYEDGNKQHIVN
jgi:hypothetical protein